MPGWKIIKSLGEGAAGSVWLAETPEGQKAALKVIPLKRESDRTCFMEEVQILVRLKHPSLVSILGCRQDSGPIFGDDRGPCYWMEWVDGRLLLDACRDATPAQIFLWLQEALEALNYLEAQKISHGDLSPNNVLIDRDGRLRILDFGEATLGGETSVSTRATLAYMAPERVDGLCVPASDLFSLGTLFYEALAGRHPRAAAGSLLERMTFVPPPLSQASPLLSSKHSREARVIDRMMESQLENRFATAASVLSALRGEDSPREVVGQAPYHSALMLGAEAGMERFQKALGTLDRRSTVFLVHGISGVGKSRFLREASFLCALKGLEVLEIEISECLDRARVPGVSVLRSLESRSLDELAVLLTLQRRGLAGSGNLLILEWNDDALAIEKQEIFGDLMKWPKGEEIHLRNLNARHTEDLLRGALGKSLRSKDVGSVFEKTGGNPRLILEVIDRIRENPETDLNSFAGLRGILASRLQALSEGQRKILTALALSPIPVELAPLRRVLESSSISEILFSLNDMTRRDLVAQGRMGEGYALAIEPLRDAILAEAREDEKTEIHRRWLYVLKDRPYPNRQRLHHALALRDNPEIEEGLLPTVECLASKGEKEEALALIKASKPFVKNAELLSKTLRVEINLLNDQGRYEAALSVCEDWILLGAKDEPSSLRAIKYWLVTGTNHQNLGRFDEAERRFRRCLEETQRWNEPEGRFYLVRAHTLLGTEAARRNNDDEALKNYAQALEFAEPTGRRRAEIYRHQATAFSRQGKWKEACGLLEESRKLYASDGFSEGEFAAFLQEGILSLDHDDPDASERAYREAERIAETHENPLLLASVWHNRAILERQRGRLAEALDLSSRAQRVFRLLHSQRDLAESLRQGTILEASVGRFAKAEQNLQALKALSSKVRGTEDIIHNAEDMFLEIKEGKQSPLTEKLPPQDEWGNHWNRELILRALERDGSHPELIAAALEATYRRLPPELQVSFVERSDYRKWHGFLDSDQKSKKSSEKILVITPEITLEKPMDASPEIQRHLLELSRALVSRDDMSHVLKRLMDTALELTGTENGFLLLENKGSKDGPIPGFVVAAARNIRKEDLGHLDYSLSLSAVRDALKSGEPVVTDNAAQDPRFREAKSVQLSGLKAILALPVVGAKGVQGVFYLDNRFRQGLFGQEILKWMEVFAAIAAVALQKGRMIEELKKSNVKLSRQIEVQASDVVTMKRELEDARLLLKHRYSDIIGRSPKMTEVLGLVDRITDSKVPVWIYGESGTGKESIARALHFNGPRAGKPFVTENCSALPESLLESELFGHKKGSFTHATADKKGILQYADGGTIFLDEIADMSVALQSKLLRFLQEGDVRPIGSNQVIKVDVRVVSASNKDLARLVQEGKFREDLFYRLNGVTVSLPPLRERMEDLPLLVEHFLKLISERDHKPQASVSTPAMELLLKYAWPGNVRELQNTLETAVLFSEKGEILPKSLKFKAALSGPEKAAQPMDLLKPVERAETKLIEVLTAIRDHCFHKGDAAKALGISRRNLYTRLARYGVASDLKTIKLAIEKYLPAR